MSVEPRISLNPHVVFTRLDDEAGVLLHLVTKRYYTLNGTGLRIWELLEQGSPREDVARTLQEEFELGGEAASGAVSRFVAELESEGLLSAAAE